MPSLKLLVQVLFLTFIVYGCKDSNNEPDINLYVCEEVLEVAENMPNLIGGIAGIQERLEYPEVALRAGIEGRVIMDLVVDKLGNPDSAYVFQGIGGGCDQEALRLTQTTSWEPGSMNNEPVCVRMRIPIVFNLPEAD